jgi:predicted N-acyltransferase
VQTEFINSIEAIKPSAWNALTGTDSPFLRHEFLAAIETSGGVGPGTGWLPYHAVLYDEGQLIAALPLYEKTDSWGEFVFDFAWANAYQQAGLSYYPKLVSAIPFTPATGSRFLTSSEHDSSELAGTLIKATQQFAESRNLSSWHVLFADQHDREILNAQGLMLRKDCQFHWHNRNFSTFDDFLGELRSVKRKKLLRERRRIRESGITFRQLCGTEMTDELWRKIMPLYASSFLRRGRGPYLNEAFFRAVTSSMPENLLVILAELHNEPIACAICFRSKDTLYGRYWGSTGRYHSLHFETCYYQGIEYCIEHGLSLFEPGAQGEHKISRGFLPTLTWSVHWIRDDDFRPVIDRYLLQEHELVIDYYNELSETSPFKKVGVENST